MDDIHRFMRSQPGEVPNHTLAFGGDEAAVFEIADADEVRSDEPLQSG